MGLAQHHVVWIQLRDHIADAVDCLSKSALADDKGCSLWLLSLQEARRGQFDAEGGNIRGLYGLIKKTVIFCPQASELQKSDFSQAASRSFSAPVAAADAAQAAANILAESLLSAEGVSLRQYERRVRAQVLTQLIRRGSRSHVCRIFNWTAPNLRKKLEDLRSDGLLADDV